MFEEIFKNQVHIILVHGRPYRQYIEHYMNSNDKFEDFILKNCDNAMERLGYKSSMVSLIGMWKENCIKKEEFDIEYGITVPIPKEIETKTANKENLNE